MYAYELDASVPKTALKKRLRQSIQASYSLYHFLWKSVLDVAAYVGTDLDLRKTRLVQKEESPPPSWLQHNLLVKRLSNDSGFKSYISKQKLDNILNLNMTRSLYKEFIQTEACKACTENPSPDAERAALEVLIDLLFQYQPFIQLLEDEFPNIEDDGAACVKAFQVILSKLEKMYVETGALKLVTNMKEELDFANELLRSTLDTYHETGRMIDKRLQNWDLERVSKLDLLLMRMSLGELISFPTIPVKVSLNEYIDISKTYSTPKSKEFINGILDKILKEMEKSGRIQKSGRGLVEE